MDPYNILIATGAVVSGLAVLVWSADRFVDGAAALARIIDMSPLLIGMLVVGFGTSAPEMMVSAFAALEGSPELALGNAYGSNVSNIALILGLTALARPITVASRVVRLELPILLAVTAVAGLMLYTGDLTRLDAMLLLAILALIMGWSLWQNAKKQPDTLAIEVEMEYAGRGMSVGKAVILTVVGLLFLVGSSRLLVWGAVEIATALGIGTLVIGLTVVAIGTSLPELAASLAAARKNEHDIAFGNIIGSNLFNTLAVVGIAGVISPLKVPSEVLLRDYPFMAGLTVLLFLLIFSKRGKGRITRIEGAILLLLFVGYTSFLLVTSLAR